MNLVDKLRKMAESNILRGKAIEHLEALEADSIRELGDFLTELADEIDAATGSVEEWADAEDRETKEEARDNALGSIENLCSAIEHTLPEKVVPAWLSETDWWRDNGTD